MFLEKLAEYADGIDTPPPMYQKKLVKYKISLSKEICYLTMSAFGNGDGKQMNVPVVRRNGILPCLLTDNAAYVLGIDPKSPDKAREAHQSFIELTRRCAAEIPEIQAVVDFLDNPPGVDVLFRDLRIDPKNFDYLARIVFEIDGVQLIDLPEIQKFWAKINVSQDDEKTKCLVCRKLRAPIEKLSIAINGIPGGQASGVALISAYEPAFWSYGLSTSLNSPMCEECATKCTNALNNLIETKDTRLYMPVKLKKGETKKKGETEEKEKTSLYTGSSIYLFWSKNPEEAYDINRSISEADPEDVAAFFSSHWKGNKTEIEDKSTFYAATISARSGRIILRDWMETSINVVHDNLECYFHLQGLIDSSGKERWFPLWHLALATVREGDPQPIVGQSLIRCALRGESLPITLLPIVLSRVYAGTKVGEKRIYCTTPQASLIKMILLSQGNISQDNISWIGPSINTKERYQLMKEIDKTCDDTAYLLGRLFAILEGIQRVALGGDINATIADKYLKTAGTAPASAFPILMQRVNDHLSKIRNEKKKRLAGYFSNQIGEIMLQLGTRWFPSTLIIEEQGRFLYGYWQQKAFRNQKQDDVTLEIDEESIDESL